MTTKISKNRGYIRLMFLGKPSRFMSFKLFLKKTMNIYIYIHTQTRMEIHPQKVQSKTNANTWKENQNNQNNSNEMENVML